ncbi:MAG: hypothetical protein ABIN04_09160 [Ginsengibacter sp.]
MKFYVSAVFIILFTSLFIVGCKKDIHGSDSFKLKAVYLYQGSNTACSSNIWQVEYSPDDEIPSGSYVSITTNGIYDPTNVRIGDIVYLKLTTKVQKAPGIEPYCSYNWTYFPQGDFM